jgi:hypothetical protein
MIGGAAKVVFYVSFWTLVLMAFALVQAYERGPWYYPEAQDWWILIGVGVVFSVSSWACDKYDQS